MKIKYFALLLIFLLQSCKQNSSESASTITIKEQWSAIRATKDLHSYERFLIENPDTELITEILDSIRVAWENQLRGDHMLYCRGHCYRLLINKEGNLFFDTKVVDEQDLMLAIKEVLLYPEKTGRFSIKETLGRKAGTPPYEIKGILQIVGADKVNPKRYASIIKLVKSGYISVRKEYAKMIFQKHYDELNRIESDSIQKLVPFNISFERHYPPPPPPPPSEE